MKSVLALPAFFLLFLSPVLAVEPTFELESLSDQDLLLFSALAEQPGYGEYRTLMSADLSHGDRLETLTHFPEHSRYIRSGAQLQIQNRFGLYRLELDGNSGPRRLSFYPSFDSGDEIPTGRILPLATSPDGRWIAIQEPLGPVRGKLVLYDTREGNRITVSESQVLDYRHSPALWSPDSRFFFYEQNGTLYYVSTRQVLEDRLPDESYREFGSGRLSSLAWTGADSLYYLSGSSLSLIRPSQFFTAAFYDDPLPMEASIGFLPIEFDPAFDRFWPAPDGKTALVLSGGRSLFHFPLNENPGNEGVSLSYMLLPAETSVEQLWWRNDGTVLFSTSGSRRRNRASQLFMLDTRMDRQGFRKIGPEQAGRFIPSPGRDRMILLEPESLSIRSADTLSVLRSFDVPGLLDAAWLDETHLLLVGADRIETLFLETGRRDFVSLSSADDAVFDSEGGIVARSGGTNYLRNSQGRWQQIEPFSGDVLVPARLESSAYRVYLEPSDSAYRNTVMVRRIDGFGNHRLFDVPEYPMDNRTGTAEEDDGRVGVLFNHGSRTRSRDVALVFNAIDGDESLGEVLSLLEDHDLRVTFFVNGDFIRRSPESARMLAESGHEIGSLFYTHMDMTDYRYRIDSEFVIRGLARNEDEFFRATGREISTLWHTPWYVISPAILRASERMNYLYVGRDVDPHDWVTFSGTGNQTSLYKPTADLIEDVLDEVRSGSIIPVRVGKPGEREDYFFKKIDLLINGLLKAGYNIVTVGELEEKSR